MKQIKFLVIALTLFMGISLTSCLNGENSTIRPVWGVLTLKNTFPYAFQVEGSKLTYTTDALTITGLAADAMPGDIIFLNAQYDTKTQPVDQNTTNIKVEVAYAEKINVNARASSVDETANRTIIPLSNIGSGLVAPQMYTKDWLIFPIPFLAEKAETIRLHNFVMWYDEANTENSASMMVLRLRHISGEPDAKKETGLVTTYKAFKIDALMNAHFSKFNAKPNTIKVITQEISGTNPEIKPGSDSDLGYRENSYTISYKEFTKS